MIIDKFHKWYSYMAWLGGFPQIMITRESKLIKFTEKEHFTDEQGHYDSHMALTANELAETPESSSGRWHVRIVPSS